MTSVAYSFSRWVLLFSLLFLCSAAAVAKPSWNQWVKQLRAEAIADGIDPNLFDRAFHGVRPDKRTLNLDRRQPERRLTYLKYRNTRGDKNRIGLGKRKYKRYGDLINQVGREYGVDPCVITALWGIETSYGHYMGDFPVIKSLATLAYDARRGAFFRRELLYALRILNEGHITLDRFVGEWAGASGLPQFLPSSWYKYAVDYDGDGRKNIWTSKADAFASIANYLKENGWQSNETWYVEVDVPSHLQHVSDEEWHSVSDWKREGVRLHEKYPMPAGQAQARLIKPYGGPYLLAFKNFNVIKRYNNSTFYAGTVGYIADKICRRR